MGRIYHYHRFSSIEKLSILSDYFSSGKSKNFICKKYNILCVDTFNKWLKSYSLEDNLLSLSVETLKFIQSMQSKKSLKSSVPCALSEVEALKAEVASLRKALEFSEMRNEGLLQVLKIGKEHYHLDLLKKAGAKQ